MSEFGFRTGLATMWLDVSGALDERVLRWGLIVPGRRLCWCRAV